jgi:hypothetical protein
MDNAKSSPVSDVKSNSLLKSEARLIPTIVERKKCSSSTLEL